MDDELRAWIQYAIARGSFEFSRIAVLLAEAALVGIIGLAAAAFVGLATIDQWLLGAAMLLPIILAWRALAKESDVRKNMDLLDATPEAPPVQLHRLIEETRNLTRAYRANVDASVLKAQEGVGAGLIFLMVAGVAAAAHWGQAAWHLLSHGKG